MAAGDAGRPAAVDSGDSGSIRMAQDSHKFEVGVRIALILFGVLLSLLVLEVAQSVYRARELVEKQKDGPALRDREFGWRPPPNVGSLNSHSLRNSPDPEEIAPGTLVILVQGDSQAEGAYVLEEETFPFHLEKCLDERLEVPVEVLNGGVIGYDINHYLTQVKHLTQVYDVDWLVMMLNYNDFGATLLEYTYSVYRPYWDLNGDTLEKVYPPWPFQEQIYGNRFQPAYGEFQEIIEPFDDHTFTYNPHHPLGWSWSYLSLRKWLYSPDPERFTHEEQDRAAFYQPHDGFWMFSPPIIEPYTRHRPVLEAIFREWATHAPHTEVLYLPPPAIFEGEATADLRTRARRTIVEIMGRGEPDYNASGDWMTEMVRGLGIPVYDFRQHLERHPDPLSLYFPDDTHFNPDGHHFNAQAVCERLVRRIQNGD